MIPYVRKLLASQLMSLDGAVGRLVVDLLAHVH